ncbi:hypothetical protein F4778DRAFT_700481 [Xylariomycetidae sp. FL2044]|nr:hypothetical protein F4778DRAFT_700481 [Xylariomycetidae sp. FL2044]
MSSSQPPDISTQATDTSVSEQATSQSTTTHDMPTQASNRDTDSQDSVQSLQSEPWEETPSWGVGRMVEGRNIPFFDREIPFVFQILYEEKGCSVNTDPRDYDASPRQGGQEPQINNDQDDLALVRFRQALCEAATKARELEVRDPAQLVDPVDLRYYPTVGFNYCLATIDFSEFKDDGTRRPPVRYPALLVKAKREESPDVDHAIRARESRAMGFWARIQLVLQRLRDSSEPRRLASRLPESFCVAVMDAPGVFNDNGELVIDTFRVYNTLGGQLQLLAPRFSVQPFFGGDSHPLSGKGSFRPFVFFLVLREIDLKQIDKGERRWESYENGSK